MFWPETVRSGPRPGRPGTPSDRSVRGLVALGIGRVDSAFGPVRLELGRGQPSPGRAGLAIRHVPRPAGGSIRGSGRLARVSGRLPWGSGSSSWPAGRWTRLRPGRPGHRAGRLGPWRALPCSGAGGQGESKAPLLSTSRLSRARFAAQRFSPASPSRPEADVSPRQGAVGWPV